MAQLHGVRASASALQCHPKKRRAEAVWKLHEILDIPLTQC
jgi:hypothetical protein